MEDYIYKNTETDGHEWKKIYIGKDIEEDRHELTRFHNTEIRKDMELKRGPEKIGKLCLSRKIKKNVVNEQ